MRGTTRNVLVVALSLTATALAGPGGWWDDVLVAGGSRWNENQIAMVADGGTVAALAPASLEGILRDFSPDNGATWEGGTYFGQGLRPAMTSLWGWRHAVYDDKRFGGVNNTELFYKRSLDHGRLVSAGVYHLRAAGPGATAQAQVLVLR